MTTTDKKCGDMEVGEFVKAIKAKDPNLILQAEVSSSKEAVNELIQKAKVRSAKYGLNTGVSRAIAALKRHVDMASAETVKGILVGAKDRPDKNWPTRFAVLTMTQNLEIGHFGLSFDKDGTKIPVNYPAAVELKIKKDPQYGSWTLKDIVTIKPMSLQEIQTAITKMDIARPVNGLYNLEGKYPVVCVRGTIADVSAIPMFEDGEQTGESWPVFVEDLSKESSKTPVMQLRLETIGGCAARISMDTRKYAHGYYDIEDLDTLCQEAIETSEKPEEQAAFMSQALYGRHVIAVGVLSSMKNKDGDDNSKGPSITYANISSHAIFEIPQSMLDRPTVIPAKENWKSVETLEKERKEKLKDSKEKPIKKATPAPKKSSDEAYDHMSGTEESDQRIPDDSMIERAKLSLGVVAKGLNKPLSQIPFQELTEKMKLSQKYPIDVLAIAYRSLTGIDVNSPTTDEQETVLEDVEKLIDTEVENVTSDAEPEQPRSEKTTT